MKMKKIVLHLGLSLIALGCGSDSKPTVNEDLVYYNDLEIQLKEENNLSDSAKALVNAINADQAVSFNAITEELVGMHASSLKSIESADASISKEELLSSIRASLPPAEVTDFHERKIKIEESIESKQKKLQYNRDAVSIANIFKDSRLQCFSGTSLLQVANRDLSRARAFQNENHVVIFTSGHVLSGYVKKNEAGENILVGIESTAAGKAEVPFGKIAELASPMQIVDAERWAVIELLKFDLANTEDLVNSVIQYTATKYGIDLENVKPLELPSTARSALAASANLLNSSPFGFGASNVPSGDQARETAETIDPIQFEQPLPNLGLPEFYAENQYSDEMEEVFTLPFKAYEGPWSFENTEVADGYIRYKLRVLPPSRPFEELALETNFISIVYVVGTSRMTEERDEQFVEALRKFNTQMKQDLPRELRRKASESGEHEPHQLVELLMYEYKISQVYELNPVFSDNGFFFYIHSDQ